MAKVAVGQAQEEREATTGFGARLVALLQALRERFAAAIEEEYAYRRPSLWLPVAAGAGAIAGVVVDHAGFHWLALTSMAFALVVALAAISTPGLDTRAP